MPAADVSTTPSGRNWTRGSTWAPFVAAALLGLAAVATSVLGSPYGPHALRHGQGVLPLQYLSTWLGTGWVWALLAFLAGWLCERPAPAAATAAAALIVALIVYYMSKNVAGVSGGLPLGGVRTWLPAALIGGPVLGVLGWFARHGGRWSRLLALAMPAIMGFETALRPAGPAAVRPWSQYVAYIAALTLAIVIAAAAVKRPRVAPTSRNKG